MTTVLDLAHISDLHLTMDDAPRWREVEHSLDEMRQQGIDHLVVTGDIVNSRCVESLRRFSKLCAKYSYGDRRRLSAVPGNHDLFGDLRSIINLALDNPRDALARWSSIIGSASVGHGTKGDGVYSNTSLPWAKTFDYRIGIAGVDTTTLDGRRGNSARGRLDRSDLQAIDQVFGRNDIQLRILAMHHVPFAREFTNSYLVEQNFDTPGPDIVRAWISDAQFDIVLHGHIHEQSEKRCGPTYYYCTASEENSIAWRHIAIDKNRRHTSEVHCYQIS